MDARFNRFLLNCYIIIFKICGLASWKVNIVKIFDPNSNINNSVYSNATYNYKYFINIILIFMTITYIIVIRTLKLWTVNTGLIVSSIVDKCLVFFGSINVIIIWLMNISRERTIANIVNEISIIDNVLKKIKHYEVMNNYSMNSMLLFKFIIIILNLCCSFFINTSITTPLWVASTTVNSMVLMQYALVLNATYHRFKSMNTMITKLGNLNTEIGVNTLFTVKHHLDESITSDIVNANHVNMKLCAVCSELADFYAIPTLLATIIYVASAIFFLHFPLTQLTFTNQMNFSVASYLHSFGTLKILITFALLTTYATKIKREFEKMGYYLHLLLDQNAVDRKTEEAVITHNEILLADSFIPKFENIYSFMFYT
ncbi:Protein of unknown function [Cotesia congregata]|uniref:Gustatory receptor n=1 Tax=Cotesia congregata TaxID=51543 RepID=A0A8J2MSQ3_COTCN|nr:Protein of unknown function [Cotesia congregata]